MQKSLEIIKASDSWKSSNRVHMFPDDNFVSYVCLKIKAMQFPENKI